VYLTRVWILVSIIPSSKIMLNSIMNSSMQNEGMLSWHYFDLFWLVVCDLICCFQKPTIHKKNKHVWNVRGTKRKKSFSISLSKLGFSFSFLIVASYIELDMNIFFFTPPLAHMLEFYFSYTRLYLYLHPYKWMWIFSRKFTACKSGPLKKFQIFYFEWCRSHWTSPVCHECSFAPFP
jgi:hypothetical protein